MSKIKLAMFITIAFYMLASYRLYIFAVENNLNPLIKSSISTALFWLCLYGFYKYSSRIL
ncbi:MAG: hypothetical protein N4A48_08295 [Tepidibacter sp.]|uniref:hypothetical protein n=1 Tax=Tepidibacter sp. TaxID=2529387 RepID=UPI0025F1E081|nr:hypothetical protein [Tepidibacter sp.]MCT4508746.1 hypothetical protein [Tepidibacter sp.]